MALVTIEEGKWGDVALHVRWIEDLKFVDIKTVDEQIKGLKVMSRNTPEKKGQQTISITIDGQNARLSTIVEIKKALQSHSGNDPLQVEIWKENNKHAVVAMEWGVKWSKQLAEQLVRLPGVGISESG